MSNYAIILAAGSGLRFGGDTPKCFIKIKNKPIWQYSLESFRKNKAIKKIVLVVPKQLIKNVSIDDKRVLVVKGGKTRNESFELGVKSIKNIKEQDKIIIHDAARINVSSKDVNKIIKSKQPYGSLCLQGKPNKRDLHINGLNIKTPQFCLYKIYKNSIKNKNGKDLFTYLNLEFNKENMIPCSSGDKNWKITFKEDLDRLF